MQLTSLEDIRKGNMRALARAISYIENGIGNYFELLKEIPDPSSRIVGITGPPGAGKSTLVDGLIGGFVEEGKKVAVLCIDPSSSLHYGALLGDRIRMSGWYNHPSVFIRSLSSRGSLGGLHPRILEIADLMKLAGYDRILIETVGVGQNEIEIAGLADTTLVVLVPEGGDEVQIMKAGLMEIADMYVVNKCDRPGADLFVRNLHMMIAPPSSSAHEGPLVLKTNALTRQGLPELIRAVEAHLQHPSDTEFRYRLLAERAYYLIRNERMKDILKSELTEKVREEIVKGSSFNLYRFVSRFL